MQTQTRKRTRRKPRRTSPAPLTARKPWAVRFNAGWRLLNGGNL